MADPRTDAGRRMAAIVGFSDTVPARTFSKAQMRGIAALIPDIERQAGALDIERLATALDLCGIGHVDGHLPSQWAGALAAEYAALEEVPR